MMVNPRKIRASFSAVRHDIVSLKDNIVEWVTALVNNQKKMLEKVKELEQRIEKVERKI